MGLIMRKKITLLLVLAVLMFSCLVFVKPVFPSAYDLSENSWVTKASMNQARAYLGVAVVNGRIFAIGGDNGGYMGNVANAIGRTNSVVNTTEEYDPVNDMWTFKTPMPTARAGFAIAVCQNRIYCIGGWTEDYSNTAVTEVYEPAKDTWETKTPMSTANTYLTANVVNGKIYVLPLHSTSIFEVYNPETDSWASKTPPPYQTTGFSSAVIGNKIYFEGGLMNTSMKCDLQVYDTLSDSWSMITTRPASFDLYGAGGITSGVRAPERIYFFMNEVTNIYDVADDRWIVGASMPNTRYCAGVAVVNDNFYVVGGRSGQWGYFVDMRASAMTEQYIPIGYGTIRPVVSVLLPENKTYNVSSALLIFTVDLPVSWMGYSLDGNDNVSIAGNTTLTDLSNGVHNLTVYAKYTPGNIGSSENILFTIDKPEPFPTTVIALASTVSVAVVGIGIFCYFKKPKR